MVITAWIFFVGIVAILVLHFVLLIVNTKYRKKVAVIHKKAGIIVATILFIPILLYTIGTCLLIMIHGECYMAYYNPGGREMIYYNGYEYYLVDDAEQAKEIAMYGVWEDVDLYISDRPIEFPYLEYWWPKLYTDELILPVNEEPIYIGRVQWDGREYYIREDVREEMQ